MFAYIVRRLALMLVTLFGISVIIFVLLRVVPGNIVDILFDAAGFVDPADKATLEKELGLSQPPSGTGNACSRSSTRVRRASRRTTERSRGSWETGSSS